MPEHFEWQTEEEGEWNDRLDYQTPSTPTRKRWKRWVATLVGLIMLLMAGSIIYLRVQSTVNEAEEGRTADVLSSYRLIEGARNQGDMELFTTFLSGADLSWAAVQQELFKHDWLLDRRAFGLGVSPFEVTLPSVELSPDLDSAVLSEIRRYRIVAPALEEEIVSLRNDSVYRLGQRWLLSPPREEFWGSDDPQELSGRLLTLIFPERDQAIAGRLFEGLDETLIDICQAVDINCPGDLRVVVEFSRDPSSLVATMGSFFEDGYLGDSLMRPGSKVELILPTPTLLGLPLDEPSYRAVFRAYSAYVAGAVMNRFTDDSCCANDIHRRAMIRNLLTSRGAMPQPDPLISPANQAAISGINYDLELMCHGTTAKSVDIFHFDSSTMTWRVEVADKELVNMQGLPDASGVALLENQDLGETYQTQLSILAAGKEWVLYQGNLSPENARNTRFEVRDREQQLLLEVPLVELGYSIYSLFDLAFCDETACPAEIHQLAGRPYWSPDGRQWLMRQDGLLWLYQESMNVAVGDGFAPFWMDSDRYGYVRQAGAQQFIVSSSTLSGTLDTITTASTLIEALPEFDRGMQLRIGRVLPDPVQPYSHWYILAFLVNRSGRIDEALILDVDNNSGRIEVIYQSSFLNSVAISPEGSKLAATYYDPDNQGWQVLIHEEAGEGDKTLSLTGERSLNAPPTISWSPDGKWLGIVNNGVLTLWFSIDGTSVEIVPPTLGCISSAWVLAEQGK